MKDLPPQPTMKESKGPASPHVAAVAATSMEATSMEASRTTSLSQSLSNSPLSSSTLSSFSSNSSSTLCKSSAYTISPCSQTLRNGIVPHRKSFFPFVRRRRASRAWTSRLSRRDKKFPMEADKGLLLHTSSEGGEAGVNNEEEKPKRELRFAAKIAAAMDADGFMGVKESVCADDARSGTKPSIYKMNVDMLYCTPSPSTPQKPPLKQIRLRRKWRICRRFRRTKVFFACMLQRIKRALASSSKRTLQVQNGSVK